MNRLSTERRIQVVSCLVEGVSLRGTTRITGVAKNTITKLLEELGQACAEYQDRVLRNLTCSRIECDEIWSFCYAKQKNVPLQHVGTPGYGDVWTWVAIDPDSKLVPSWLVGERGAQDAYVFLSDLKRRLRNRVQLTTDGHLPYLTVIEPLFGADAIDFIMLKKLYGNLEENKEERGYSKASCIGVAKTIITGEPDQDLAGTSYVERQNLTMRMGMRRFTRLTNGFSKKVENLTHAVSLHYMYYNFARPHMSLNGDTPAMAAGVAKYPMSIGQIIQLLDPLPTHYRREQTPGLSTYWGVMCSQRPGFAVFRP